MVIADVLNSWFSSIKKIAFRYKDGFFELPLISNSPETIIKSLSRMPFVYNDSKKEEFGTKNPFVNTRVPYHKIEEGLWVFYSKAYYKENINYLRAKENAISDEYHNLYLEINSNTLNHKNVLLNGTPYSNTCWVIHKPFNTSTYCKFKGCETVSIVLHFTKEWLQKTLEKEGFYKESQLEQFFNSKAEFVIISEALENSNKIEEETKSLFEKKLNDKITKEEWQSWAMDFFKSFTKRFNQENVQGKMFDIGHADRMKLAKAENILMEGLFDSFMGIQQLSAQVGMSPTKLKSNFKLVYGASIFQYFRSVQMARAKVIIEQNQDRKIQEISKMFGYSNMTKFANAFKSVHDLFPSEIVKVASANLPT